MSPGWAGSFDVSGWPDASWALPAWARSRPRGPACRSSRACCRSGSPRLRRSVAGGVAPSFGFSPPGWPASGLGVASFVRSPFGAPVSGIRRSDCRGSAWSLWADRDHWAWQRWASPRRVGPARPACYRSTCSAHRAWPGRADRSVRLGFVLRLTWPFGFESFVLFASPGWAGTVGLGIVRLIGAVRVWLRFVGLGRVGLAGPGRLGLAVGLARSIRAGIGGFVRLAGLGFGGRRLRVAVGLAGGRAVPRVGLGVVGLVGLFRPGPGLAGLRILGIGGAGVGLGVVGLGGGVGRRGLLSRVVQSGRPGVRPRVGLGLGVVRLVLRVRPGRIGPGRRVRPRSPIVGLRWFVLGVAFLVVSFFFEPGLPLVPGGFLAPVRAWSWRRSASRAWWGSRPSGSSRRPRWCRPGADWSRSGRSVWDRRISSARACCCPADSRRSRLADWSPPDYWGSASRDLEDRRRAAADRAGPGLDSGRRVRLRLGAAVGGRVRPVGLGVVGLGILPRLAVGLIRRRGLRLGVVAGRPRNFVRLGVARVLVARLRRLGLVGARRVVLVRAGRGRP